jgi:hypothetical protein
MSTSRDKIIEQLHGARALAEKGEHQGAFDMATSAQKAFPNDPETNHLTGVALKIATFYDDAETYFKLAHGQDAEYMYPAMELADIALIRGDGKAAEAWANEAVLRNSNYIQAHLMMMRAAWAQHRFEAAVELMAHILTKDKRKEFYLEIVEQLIWISRRDRCIIFLDEALNVFPNDPELTTRCAELLCELQRYREVVDRWSDRTPLERHDEFLDSIVGLARLSLSFDTTAVISRTQKLEASKRWVNATATAKLIFQAVKQRKPLSLIRLGDGEARFLIFCENNASHVISAPERTAIGHSILWNWFGQDAKSIPQEAYKDIYDRLINSVRNADILGRTDSKRLAKDTRHFGFLAYMEERVDELSPRHQAFANAFINTSLHEENFYKSLFEKIDFIGAIGPHPDLAEAIAKKFKIASHKSYVIPGEMRLPNREGLRNGVDHYPAVYNSILETLEVPFKGAVYLVAGGLLGKIYCDRVKQLGGIALDIGSIADVWMGFNTRPGQYDASGKWTLL